MSDQPRADAGKWWNRPPLTGTDLTDFLALRRVCGPPGFLIVRVGDQFLEGERLLLPFIIDGLNSLIEVGHATLGEPDPESSDTRPVHATASGRARYEQLCDKQGIPPYPAWVTNTTSQSN